MRHHELPRVLRRAVGLTRFARSVVGASAASVFLIDPISESLRGLLSEWDWTRTSFFSKLTDWPSVALALADGEVRRVSADDAQGAETGWFEARGIGSTLCVPLRSGEQSLGVLFFDFDARGASLGKADAALLADVGRRCARAIARAAPSPNLEAT